MTGSGALSNLRAINILGESDIYLMIEDLISDFDQNTIGGTYLSRGKTLF